MSDRIVGIGLFILAVAYGLQARGFETAIITDPLGPSAFPLLLAVALGVASLYLIVRPEAGPQWPRRWVLMHLAIAVVVLIGYAFVLVPIGFIAATFLVLTLLAVQLGSRIAPSALMGILASVGLYVIFDRLLGLPLPAGTLLFGA